MHSYLDGTPFPPVNALGHPAVQSRHATLQTSNSAVQTLRLRSLFQEWTLITLLTAST